MVALGYTAGNAKSFNFWKMALLTLFILPFVDQFGYGKAELLTMLVAFFIGFFLPYAHVLEGLSGALSDAINSIRYRSAYEDIRRKEEEIDELRRKYEQAQQESNSAQQESEQARRREESKQYRQSQQKQQKSDSHQQHSKQQESGEGQQQNKSSSTRSNYLRMLSLDPDSKNYNYADIKKAYRRQASKYHPDKHHGKPAHEVKEMNDHFREVKEAYEWLALHDSV